jgi:hypothetical protein
LVRHSRARPSAATTVRSAAVGASRSNRTHALACASSLALGVGPCANAEPVHLNRRPSVNTKTHCLTECAFALDELAEQLDDVTRSATAPTPAGRAAARRCDVPAPPHPTAHNATTLAANTVTRCLNGPAAADRGRHTATSLADPIAPLRRIEPPNER